MTEGEMVRPDVVGALVAVLCDGAELDVEVVVRGWLDAGITRAEIEVAANLCAELDRPARVINAERRRAVRSRLRSLALADRELAARLVPVFGGIPPAEAGWWEP